MPAPVTPRRLRHAWWIGAAALVALTLWLRAPGFGFRTWNVDEAIHSAIATTLRDGGVLYRDAIDQRTPLTYVALASLYSVFGSYNLAAAHLSLALLVAATGLLLSALARRGVDRTTAIWAAALYPLLGSVMFFVGDANAFVTEWFVAFFTTAAALCFFSGQPESPSRLLVTGALFSGAFLAKQPGALDLLAPALTLLLLLRRGPALRLVRAWSWLVLGFVLPVLAVAGYYAAQDALRDAVFYTWTYNLHFYGPEIDAATRLAGLFLPLRLLFGAAPLLFGVLVYATLSGIRRLLTRSPAATDEAPALPLYVTAWFVSASVAAASGGRNFDHYAIQALPPLCLLLATALSRLTEPLLRETTPRLARTLAGLLLVAVVAALARDEVAARRRTLPVDPSRPVADFIAARTRADERIFVWGYHPDIYLFAERRPASRFVYASFVTGLIPWTNVASERDTAYAIVPGALDTLLRDLRASRPAFIVDCSAGPNRYWAKYPLSKFPALAAFVAENYLPVETAQFVAQGFRLFVIRDSFRLPATVTPPSPPAGAHAGTIGLFHDGLDPFVRIAAHQSDGHLARIELSSDERLVAGVSLVPGRDLTVDIPLPPQTGDQPRRLRAVARDAGGMRLATAELDLAAQPPALPPERLASFSIPCGDRRIAPSEIIAPFGAEATDEEGQPTRYAHAPSRLRFELPDSASALRGAAGFRPGAYAEDNRFPTDGADFRVDLVTADGTRRTLWHRSLAPRNQPGDRAPLPFRIELPPGPARRLELVVDPGRFGSPASDWTRWTGLSLETSH